MRFKIPDWLIYGTIVLLIYLNATRATHNQIDAPPPPPKLGELLPGESPRDQSVMVDIEAPESGVGTAFAIDDTGSWMTARHVVDGCDSVVLRLGSRRGMIMDVELAPDSDSAILRSQWDRKPLPTDLEGERTVGEHGFFFGFPQGRPGEAVGKLIGRHKLIVRGRYRSEEPILAWAEISRTSGMSGSLGGLSGAPALDKDGEVIGIVAAESPRRGRIYTVAPVTLKDYLPASAEDRPAESIESDQYHIHADKYRRELRIAQVICLVK